MELIVDICIYLYDFFCLVVFVWIFNGRLNINEILIVFFVGLLMWNVNVMVGVVDVLELCGFKVE